MDIYIYLVSVDNTRKEITWFISDILLTHHVRLLSLHNLLVFSHTRWFYFMWISRLMISNLPVAKIHGYFCSLSLSGRPDSSLS